MSTGPSWPRTERRASPAERRTPTARRAVAGVITLAALATLAACRGGNDEARAETAGGAPPAVTVGKENITIVRNDTIQAGPAISGSLMPEVQATIRAELSGSVLQIYVEQGQRVTKGTLLARIEDISIRDAYLSARSAVTSAETAEQIAARELERQERLLQAGAVAERDVETARSANVSARAALADARSRLALAERQLSNTRITAPFTGVVAVRSVSAGDVVTTGAELFTLVGPSSMRLEASVPAEQLSAVRVGAPVTFAVSGYGDRTFTGRITRVSPVADPTTGQVRIIASIPNSGNTLVGGLFAQGRVASESRPALVVPQSAVDQRGVAPVVNRIKQGKVERVTVDLGIRDASTETVEVRSGLAAGDTVLVGAASAISPGTAVRVGEVTDQGTAATATNGTQK
jgi:membrane fusion protein, multidrug efflux system